MNWLAHRKAIRDAVWGSHAFPTRADPDLVANTNVSGMKLLVWNISSEFLQMTSTVFHHPRRRGKRAATAVLQHGDHAWGNCRHASCANGTRCDLPNCRWWDNEGVWELIHDDLRSDAFYLFMPLRGVNHQRGYPYLHDWFARFQAKGDATLRYFIEPTILTINHALKLGHERVMLLGKSGGGWTGTVAAAVDPRVSVSLLVAGSLPWSFKGHQRGDYEQRRQRNPEWYLTVAGNYTTLYALAALEPGRRSIQVLHEDDECCFHGRNRHEQIHKYNCWIRAQLAAARPDGAHGAFATAVTEGRAHAITQSDKRLLLAAVAHSANAGFDDLVPEVNLLATSHHSNGIAEASRPYTKC